MRLEGDDTSTIPTTNVPQSTAQILTRCYHIAAIRMELAVRDRSVVPRKDAKR